MVGAKGITGLVRSRLARVLGWSLAAILGTAVCQAQFGSGLFNEDEAEEARQEAEQERDWLFASMLSERRARAHERLGRRCQHDSVAGAVPGLPGPEPGAALVSQEDLESIRASVCAAARAASMEGRRAG